MAMVLHILPNLRCQHCVEGAVDEQGGATTHLVFSMTAFNIAYVTGL
jgi:hypothetical protein